MQLEVCVNNSPVLQSAKGQMRLGERQSDTALHRAVTALIDFRFRKLVVDFFLFGGVGLLLGTSLQQFEAGMVALQIELLCHQQVEITHSGTDFHEYRI